MAYLDANNRWALNIADPGRDNLFAGQVYVRGAAALYALRGKIGDAAFLAGARSWLSRNSDSTATTEDFQAVMEKASRQQLGAFFDDWLRQATARRCHKAPDQLTRPAAGAARTAGAWTKHRAAAR